MVAVITGVETGVMSGVNSPCWLLLLLVLSLESSSLIPLLVVPLLLCRPDIGVVVVNIKVADGVLGVVVVVDGDDDDDEIPAHVSNAATAMARSILRLFSSLSSSFSFLLPRNDPSLLSLSKTETRAWANCSSCSC
ncbi:MAG: hypothetical protein J3R72DRAFT_432854, partial [Linnemannia gamsii]